MKLPVQPPQYNRGLEQQRSATVEREFGLVDSKIKRLIADAPAGAALGESDEILVLQGNDQVSTSISSVMDAVYSDDWTDLVVSGTAINPPGAAADPSVNSTTGLLEFSASADNVCVFSWQLPHGWSGEFDETKAVVVPHFHVRHLTSTSAPNNVSRWKFEYDVADANGDFVNAYGTFTTLTTVSVTNPANTKKCGIVSFGDLDLAGYGASTIMHCRITRLASSDAADTDTSVIALVSADLHYQVRRSGTDQQIPT